MDIRVSKAEEGTGVLIWGTARLRCAIGRGGIRGDKREGDGATPAGLMALRRVLYRPDRLARPVSVLACAPLSPGDGWCDDPTERDYNRPVSLPHAGRAERLWREDGIYDLIVVLGYNDDPVVPGRGSAIFLHLANPGYPPTQGCVALMRADLLALLKALGPAARLRVTAES